MTKDNSQLSQSMKFCQRCQTTKPFGEFYYYLKKSQFSYACKACTRKKNNEHERQKRLTDKEWVKADSKAKVARRKRKWHTDLALYETILARNRTYAKTVKDMTFAAYGGYCCTCCGERHEDFLCIDHVNGGGGEHRRKIGKGGAPSYRWLKKNAFPKGFQVLCLHCNWSKHLPKNNGICIHVLESSTIIPQGSRLQVEPKRPAPHDEGGEMILTWW